MEKHDPAPPQKGTESALAGVLVMDLTTARSGPTCTKILADFGANVVRIERPGDSESGRVFYDRMDLHRRADSGQMARHGFPGSSRVGRSPSDGPENGSGSSTLTSLEPLFQKGIVEAFLLNRRGGGMTIVVARIDDRIIWQG